MSDDLEMRSALLAIARDADGPIRASDLWRRASRRANGMTPFAIVAMWDLVYEGLLDYDASAMVTVVKPSSR